MEVMGNLKKENKRRSILDRPISLFIITLCHDKERRKGKNKIGKSVDVRTASVRKFNSCYTPKVCDFFVSIPDFEFRIWSEIICVLFKIKIGVLKNHENSQVWCLLVVKLMKTNIFYIQELLSLVVMIQTWIWSEVYIGIYKF